MTSSNEELYDEIMAEYSELMEVVKDSDDSLWPEWLFKPSFNDFDDNYYAQSFVDTEQTSQVKRLKRRYNDYFEYVDAMNIYEDYMATMVEKYGSMRVIKNSLEIGTLNDPIPSKPKLKSTKRNKQFMRLKSLPSRQLHIEVDEDDIIAIARQLYPNQFGEDIDPYDNHVPKKQRELYEKIQKQIDGDSRRRNLYRTVGNNRGTDFIVEYLNQAKHGVFSSPEAYSYDQNASLADIVKEMEREADGEELRDSDLNATVISHGRLVSRRDLQKTEIYKELYEEGFDILHNLGRSGMAKSSVKMIKSEIGATEPMTKKELRKMKKQAKKEQQRIQRRKDSNNLLESILLNNKIDSGSRDQNGNISFRLRDLYKDD